MNKRKLVGYLLVVALSAAACGGGGDGGGKAGEGAATPPPSYDVEKGLGSAASDLRAELTEMLQEHVFLTGITTDAVVAGRDAAPGSAVLDQNATALANLFGGVYGDPAAPRFLELWRRQNALVLDFARASAAGDQAATGRIKGDLEALGNELTTFLSATNPQHTPDTVGEDHEAYVRLLLATVTAQAKKEAEAYADLKEAADHAPKTATLLASGIVKLKDRPVEGSIDAMGAVLRSTLAAKLQQHTYLAGVATAAALGGGDFEAAARPLDENSLELSRAISSAYGDDAGRQFLSLWRQHIGFFVDYTRAAARGDQAGMSTAKADLDGYRSAFAAFLSAANPNLGKDAVAAELGVHVDTLIAAIQAQAAKDASQVLKLRDAADHMPHTGFVLASAIARQFPQKFG